MIETIISRGLPISIYSFLVFFALVSVIYPRKKKRIPISHKSLNFFLIVCLLYVVLQAIFYDLVALNIKEDLTDFSYMFPLSIVHAGIIISIINVVISYVFLKKLDLKKSGTLKAMIFRILMSIIPLLISALFLAFFFKSLK